MRQFLRNREVACSGVFGRNFARAFMFAKQKMIEPM